MGWAVKLKRNVPFQGREAIEVQRGQKLKKFLCTFTVNDPSIVLLGRETIYRNGERVGWLNSGGFGHSIGKPIGLGYVRQPQGLDEDYLRDGKYQLEVATERVDCNLHLAPLFDPEMKRIKV